MSEALNEIIFLWMKYLFITGVQMNLTHMNVEVVPLVMGVEVYSQNRS